MSKGLTLNMAMALLRLIEGEAIIYMRGNRDLGGCWNEQAFMSGRPQLGLHMRTYRTALRRGYIERRSAPRGIPELYRADPERYQAYVITRPGMEALNAYCLALPVPGKS